MTNATGTLDQTITLSGSPADVYRALTDSAEHTRFTGAEATGEPKVGETFTAWDGYITGKYLELVPDKKIVAEWSTSEWPEGAAPSKLTLTLTADGGQTKLALHQEVIPADQVDKYDAGWHESYWLPLESHLRTEDGKQKTERGTKQSVH